MLQLDGIEEALPEFMLLKLGELPLWQWLAMLGVLLVAYSLAVILSSLAARLALRLTGRTENALDDAFVHASRGPLTALLTVTIFLAGSAPFPITEGAREFVTSGGRTLILLSIVWYAIRLVDVAAIALERQLSERGDSTALTIVPVGRRVAKLFLILLAVLAGLQNMGFNVISILAGLGVVGIGVALAAQKTFEDFFGALAILVDQPVKRGDFCRFGDRLGTVEDIGLRSTRVRTLDRTVVTVPNAEFSHMQLENYGRRDKVLFRAILGLRYETSADQLRHVLHGLRALLASDPHVADEKCRVRFVEFGAFSLDLELYCYLHTTEWVEFLAMREELLLKIVGVVETSGTGFAFPSQTLYLGQDNGLDPDTRVRVEAELRASGATAS